MLILKKKIICYVKEWTITPTIVIQQNAWGAYLKGL